jgi:hypothetical protein
MQDTDSFDGRNNQALMNQNPWKENLHLQLKEDEIQVKTFTLSKTGTICLTK